MNSNAESSESPLKSAPKAPLQSKYEASWHAILSDSPVANSESGTLQFYHDLFCLNPIPGIVQRLLLTFQRPTLLKNSNLQHFFIAAITTLKRNASNQANVVDNLIPFLSHLLSQVDSNIEILTVLAGTLDKSDSIFQDLVTALDDILRDSNATISLQEKTLHLCLTVAAGIGQGPINSYFLRRDFFPTLCKLITGDRANQKTSAQALLLIGLLASYHKFEMRSLYLRRLSDLVDEDVMLAMLKTVQISVEECQQAYICTATTAPASFVSSITSLLASFSLINVLRPSTEKTAGNADIELPHIQAALTFFPFYDLVHVNKAFLNFLLDSTNTNFTSHFFSYISYTFRCASNSTRSQLYGRLNLIFLTMLVEDGSIVGLTSEHNAIPVKLCCQSNPILQPDGNPPLLCCILDCVLIFIRSNLSRKLDIESYLLAVRLIHKSTHRLKMARVRLKYDWANVWQALITLSSLIIKDVNNIRTKPDFECLITEILIVFDFCCFWSDVIFQRHEDFTLLFYELLRSESTFDRLSDLIAGTSFNSTKTVSDPLSITARGLQSMRNIKAVIASLSTKVDEYRDHCGFDRPLVPEEIELIVSQNSEKLELVESVGLEDVRPYNENGYESTHMQLFNMTAADISIILQST